MAYLLPRTRALRCPKELPEPQGFSLQGTNYPRPGCVRQAGFTQWPPGDSTRLTGAFKSPAGRGFGQGDPIGSAPETPYESCGRLTAWAGREVRRVLRLRGKRERGAGIADHRAPDGAPWRAQDPKGTLGGRGH